MTKLEEEKQKKKELEIDTDYLKEVDKPDGWKYVRSYEEENQRKAMQGRGDRLNKLEPLKNKAKVTYLSWLATFCKEKTSQVELPTGWECEVIPTTGQNIRVYGRSMKTREGVAAIMKSPEGNVYIRAILAAFKPEIDLKNMSTLASQVENTSDSARGILLSDKKDPVTGMKKTKSGVIIPS